MLATPEIPRTPDIQETLARIPESSLGEIVAGHLDYLDGLFYDIERLTEYLATCREISKDRVEYVRFVDSFVCGAPGRLAAYTDRFATRFINTRRQVLRQCEAILAEDPTSLDTSEFLSFWEDFAYANEYDNLHGMFLTSGRWYTNGMLPVVRELALDFLERSGARGEILELSASLAYAVITPEFAIHDSRPDRQLVNDFSRVLRGILESVDYVLFDTYRMASSVDLESIPTVESLIRQVSEQPERFAAFLTEGVYPPFAWAEITAAREGRRERTAVPDAPALGPRGHEAIGYLRIFKVLERDYNLFNYKGYFPLVSKYFYLRSALRLGNQADSFRMAILGDRFFEALAVVQRQLAR